MKKTILILCIINIVACTKKNNQVIKQDSDSIQTDLTSTEYIAERKDLLPDFYLFIDNIYNGSMSVDNENDEEFFYRLIEVSKEESKSIFFEKIKLVGESDFELIERKELSDNITNLLGSEISTFVFKEWVNEKVAVVNINDSKLKIDFDRASLQIITP